MKKRLLAVLLSGIITIVLLFPGPALSIELITATETVIVENVEIEIVKTADNFIILYDTSESMNQPYKDTNMTKIEVEKKILKDQHEKMPDLKFNAGLYSFTPNASASSFKSLQPYYEMQPYNQSKFAEAIDKLPTKGSGPTLLQGGLAELGKILKGLTGHTVVFIVTDGKYNFTKNMKKPVEIARTLAQKYGVSFYVISTAPDKDAEKILTAVASINEYSRVIPFDDLLGKPEYITGALFVVDRKLVSTPVSMEVAIGVKLNNVLFDFGTDAIRPEYISRLNLLGEYLQANPDIYAIFAGFADNSGDAEYNMGLSRRRAETIESYLIEHFPIDPDRIITLWYGDADPAADNNTQEGRQLNRRVESILTR